MVDGPTTPVTTGEFPTDPAGLPECGRPQVVDLADGDHFDLRIGPVAKRLGSTTLRLVAYSGSIPGPVLRVREGSELVVNVVNEGDMEATVHWHGLRLDNRYDGTHETQKPIPVGGSFTYRISFPDPGVYWYHPHSPFTDARARLRMKRLGSREGSSGRYVPNSPPARTVTPAAADARRRDRL
jgi:FtsP/CotA-like multicopper oxidase with cupredoxin domain